MQEQDRGYQFPLILPRDGSRCIKGSKQGIHSLSSALLLAEFGSTSASLFAEFGSTSALSLALGPRAVWTNDHSGPNGPRARVVSPAHEGEEIS